MRYIAILLLLSSCSANFHLRQALKKGIKPETTIVNKTDSIFFGSLNDSISQIVIYKTVEVNADCDSLLKANPEKDTIYIRKIQKKVCPRIAIDSVYRISLIVQDSTYFINVHVFINSDGGKFTWKITGNDLNIPIKTQTIKNTYKPESPIKWWWLVITAFFFLFVGIILRR